MSWLRNPGLTGRKHLSTQKNWRRFSMRPRGHCILQTLQTDPISNRQLLHRTQTWDRKTPKMPCLPPLRSSLLSIATPKDRCLPISMRKVTQLLRSNRSKIRPWPMVWTPMLPLSRSWRLSPCERWRAPSVMAARWSDHQTLMLTLQTHDTTILSFVPIVLIVSTCLLIQLALKLLYLVSLVFNV